MFMLYPGQEPTPEELSLHQAGMTEGYLRQMSFLTNLSADQLADLHQMLAKGLEYPEWQRQMVGLAYGLLYGMHGVCHCTPNEHKRADHDRPEWLAKVEAPTPSEEQMQFNPTTDFDKEEPSKTWLEVWIEDNPKEAHALNSWLTLRRGYSMPLEAYTRSSLEDVYELDHDESSSTVRCRRCLYEFSSLEDRMLKTPDFANCRGCVHKTKHG